MTYHIDRDCYVLQIVWGGPLNTFVILNAGKCNQATCRGIDQPMVLDNTHICLLDTPNYQIGGINTEKNTNINEWD